MIAGRASLDLHARYAALDDARYWHVQPWPRHERPQRWIIQLARKRILALKRLVAQRHVEGDRACIEGIEIMGFLATLVGLTSVERFIPLATPETERRDVLAARNGRALAARTRLPRAAPVAAESPRARNAEPRRASDAAGRRTQARRRDHAPDARAGACTSRRVLAAQRAGAAAKRPRRLRSRGAKCAANRSAPRAEAAQDRRPSRRANTW